MASGLKNCKDCVYLERGLWVRFRKKHSERKCLRTLSADFAPTMMVERILNKTGCGPSAKHFVPLRGK